MHDLTLFYGVSIGLMQTIQQFAPAKTKQTSQVMRAREREESDRVEERKSAQSGLDNIIHWFPLKTNNRITSARNTDFNTNLIHSHGPRDLPLRLSLSQFAMFILLLFHHHHHHTAIHPRAFYNSIEIIASPFLYVILKHLSLTLCVCIVYLIFMLVFL